MPQIIFDRQGLIISHSPARTVKANVGDGDDYYEQEIHIRIIRPIGIVSLKGNYIKELKKALAEIREEG